MKSSWFTIIIAVVIFIQLAHSTTVSLPVSQETLTRLNLSIQKLEDLLKYFGTFYENKLALYKRIELTKVYLNQLSNELAKYNNVIAGSNNAVNGNKNIVIGNYNSIAGSNNWVFVSQFTGEINGDLLIGQWRIELDKSNLILINTRFAISFLQESRNAHLKNKYWSKNRQMCKWDKWTRPDNQKSNNFWKKYNGYNQWRTSFLQSSLNLVGSFLGSLGKTTSSWGSFGFKI